MARLIVLLVVALLGTGTAPPPDAAAAADGRLLPVELGHAPGGNTTLPTPAWQVGGSQEGREDVAWAVQRFADVGLELPPVTVAFHSNREPCRGNVGYASGEGRIDICDDRDRVRILMHELAHIWADAALDEETREAFVDFRGTPSWNDSDNWYDHASEQAAETIAWVLLEGEIHLKPRMTMKDPASLRTGFSLLTGIAVPAWDGDPATPWQAPRSDGIV